MKITLKKLRAFRQYQDLVEEELSKLGRSYAAAIGQDIRGGFEHFSIWGNCLNIYFKESYQGGTEDYQVKIPLSFLEDADFEAATEKMKNERLAKEAAILARNNELAKMARQKQYEKLKEEFG